VKYGVSVTQAQEEGFEVLTGGYFSILQINMACYDGMLWPGMVITVVISLFRFGFSKYIVFTIYSNSVYINT